MPTVRPRRRRLAAPDAWSPVVTVVALAVACASEPTALPDAGAPAEDAAAAPDVRTPRPRFDGGMPDGGPCYGDPGNAGVARALFDEPTPIGALPFPERPVLGDLDGDGDLDLAVSHFDETGTARVVTAALNDGRGGFTLGTPIPVADTEPLVAADLDGDGRAELLVSALAGARVVAVDAGGRWSEVETVPGLGPSVSAADLDGDGRAELLEWGARVRIFSRGAAGALAQAADLGLVDYARTGGAADLDGDGRLELVSWGPVNVMRRTGAGLDAFAPAVRVDVGSAALADVDGDGAPELVGLAATQLAAYQVAAGRLTPVGTTVLGSAGALLALDLDGDAARDLVVVERGLALLRAVPGQAGRFVVLGRLPAFDGVGFAVAGDVDGDGRADVVLTDGAGLRLRRRTAVDPPPLDLACVGPEGPAPPTPELETDDGTIYVDDTPGCGGHRPCSRSIQAAVDGAAPRTRIEVRTGVYPEAVSVHADLTLTSSSGAWIRGVGDGPCVLITGSAQVTLAGFVISHCSGGGSSSLGYGVVVYGDGFDVRLIGNYVHDNGPNGGISIYFPNVGDSGRALIEGNRIVANGSPLSAFYRGAGLSVDGLAGPGSSVTILNNIIVDNTAEAGLSALAEVDLLIAHNTIARNRVSFAGLLGPRGGRVENNIIAGNRDVDDLPADVAFLPAVSATFNLVGAATDPPPPTNFVADPRLVHGPGAAVRLAAGSPAIDAADPASATATDFEGDARPQDGDGDGTARADIGADERCVGCP